MSASSWVQIKFARTTLFVPRQARRTRAPRTVERGIYSAPPTRSHRAGRTEVRAPLSALRESALQDSQDSPGHGVSSCNWVSLRTFSGIVAAMIRQSISAPFLVLAVLVSMSLEFPAPLAPTKTVAAEAVSAPLQVNAAESRTNELEKILATQETLVNTVNQMREATESAAQRNAEALRRLREEMTAATQRTRDELVRNSGALEQVLGRQFEREVDILQKMNRSTVVTFSALIGLGLMAFVSVSIVLWRALRRMAEPRWAQANVGLGSSEPVPALPGDQADEFAGMSAQLGDATLPASVQKLERLEKRILQLESEAAAAAGRRNPGKTGSEPSHAGSRRDNGKKESAEVKEWLDKGQALLKSGQTEEALEHFGRAIRAGSVGGEPHVWKGTALEELGRLDEALAAYNEAIAADPALNTAHLRKGGLCNRLGRLDEAFLSFERVLQSLGRPLDS
jgi:tetratricopeptide (TPR) repeat protein